MATERNQVIPAAFLLLLQSGKVLLQRRFNTGFQDGTYSLLSGHVDKGESPIDAICREAMEEAGIVVEKNDITFEQVLYRRSFDAVKDQYNPTDPERVDFFFSTEHWLGEPTIMEPNKCDDLQWFPLDAMPEKMFPIARTFLENFKRKLQYKESGFE